MPIFEANSAYASDVSIRYDEQKQRYVGELLSRGGAYMIEAMDRADAMYQIDAILQEEYRQMIHDVARIRSRGGDGRGRGGGGDTNDAISGHKVHRVAAGTKSTRGLSGSGQLLDVAMAAVSLATGNWIDLALTVASQALNDGLDKADDMFGGDDARMFAVVFGGILITAASRGELMKKLMRQKHIRMHMILSHIKTARAEREKNSTTMDYAEAMTFGALGREKFRARLKAKKQKALNWRKRVSPQGELTGWRARSLNLRDRVQNRKENAKEFWISRV